MQKMVTAKIILQVGSLQFMEAEGAYVFGKSTFYWKFQDSSVYYGPFNTLYEAGSDVDYKMIGKTTPVSIAGKVLDSPSDKTEEIKNVIHIDFKLKRRL